MRSPAAAFGWELLRKHRWGFSAIAGYLVALANLNLVLGAPIATEGTARFALTLVVPLTLAYFYFIAVFCFGLSGDVAGRQSIFPARMFTLPVSDAALAGWPMCYATVAVMTLWLATSLLVRWPTWLDMPLVWPALFGAAIMAWTQALMWMPYGLPGLRVIVAAILLVTGDTIVILGLELKVSNTLMIAGLAPMVPLGYLAGRVAVGLARRGGVADWREQFARVGQLADLVPRRQRPFASPARAQLWFEWRQHGRVLPVLVAMVLPFELALLFLPGATDSPGLVWYPLLCAVLTPRLMAAFVALSVRTPNTQDGDPSLVPPFMSARPMATAGLIAAKLHMAIWSTLAAWLLVLIAIPLALVWSDTWPLASERLRDIGVVIGRPRVIALAVLVVLGLMASTWKQLVQGLCIGLTGRAWLVRVNTIITLCLTCAIVPGVSWFLDSAEVRTAVWDALPRTVTVLAVVKMAVAAWIATRLYDSRPLSDRLLVAGAAGWLLAVLALYGSFAWLVSGPQIPQYFLLLAAILIVPLGRLSAAPVALAWNRHR